VVSEVVLNKVNQHVFDRHQLAYICIDHSQKVLEFSENVKSYGFDNIQLGKDVSESIDFMVGVDTHQNIELPMMETPSGIPVSVNMLPDADTMTVLMLNAETQMEYRSMLQQAANENELLVDQQQKLMLKLEDASKQLSEKNQQLKEANRLQTSFLSGVSHEFRTPLTSIIGYTDLVKQNLSNESEDATFDVVENSKHLTATSRSSKHLLSLVENLLDHGKLDSNEVVVRSTAVDLFEVLGDVSTLLKPLCDSKEIELIFVCDIPAPFYVYLDDSRLRQCLINLVGNAVKFTDYGTVRVESKWANDTLSVKIVDTGLGISAENLKKIRLPFWQAEGTGKVGTGLGLTITERIIDLMGGDLHIDSTLGKGTVVNFNWSAPLIDSPEEEVAPSLPSGLKVLLAEDDFDIAGLMIMLLAEANIDVVHAQNGEIALEQIESQTFDLVLMDLNMPVMNGYEAIERLSEANNKVPIVVMSASPLDDQSPPVELLQCEAYLVKPVGVDDIIRVASELLN